MDFGFSLVSIGATPDLGPEFGLQTGCGPLKCQWLLGFEVIAPMKIFVCEQGRTRANSPEHGRKVRRTLAVGLGRFARVRGLAMVSAPQIPRSEASILPQNPRRLKKPAWESQLQPPMSSSK